MPKYINADEMLSDESEAYIRAQTKISDIETYTLNYLVHAKIQRLLHDAPAADAQAVRHGYWIPSPDGINPIRCSECNMPAPFIAGENEFGDFEIRRYSSSYCHECGAKMDGTNENQAVK